MFLFFLVYLFAWTNNVKVFSIHFFTTDRNLLLYHHYKQIIYNLWTNVFVGSFT